jgi:hypothetical protein
MVLIARVKVCVLVVLVLVGAQGHHLCSMLLPAPPPATTGCTCAAALWLSASP